MALWHVCSGAIDEYVHAPDQWVAWHAFCDRPVEDFGLIASAEPDENGDPVLARSSGLMFWWGRDDDARALIAAAVADGLPDTTERDKTFAPR